MENQGGVLIMNEDKLREIEARAAEATLGPWYRTEIRERERYGVVRA